MKAGLHFPLKFPKRYRRLVEKLELKEEVEFSEEIRGKLISELVETIDIDDVVDIKIITGFGAVIETSVGEILTIEESELKTVRN